MIRYLRGTKHQEIRYGTPGKGHGPGDQLPVERDFNLIEVFADASFCPGSDRSQTGIVLMWGNAPVGWLSMRQPCASLSTAEAELQASLDGMTLAEGLHGLLSELAESPQKSYLYNDNVGACTVMSLPQGSWRTRHLRLKAAWFFEQLELSRFKAYHVPGKYMLGDLCTKALLGPRVKELLNMMSVSCDESPSGADGGESAWKSLNVLDGYTSGSTRSGGDGRVRQAIRAITAASVLESVASKLLKVQVELDDSQTESYDLLKYLCALLVLVGLVALSAWKCRSRETPRIRVVRETDERSDEDWSVILGSEPEGADHELEARFSGRSFGSLTNSVPYDLRGSRTPPDDEGTTGSGYRSSTVPVYRSTQGPLTPGDDDDDCDDGFRNISEEGLRRRVGSDTNPTSKLPRTLVPQPHMREGSRGGGLLSAATSSASAERASEFFLVRDAGNEMVGAYARYVDDEAVVGTPAAVKAMLPDEEPEEQTAPQTVTRRFDDHRERLVIHPGWTLKAPPILNRDLIPDWGGPEALMHQKLPPSLTADIWYIDRRRGVLTRFHAVARQRLYVPSKQGIPDGVEWAELTGRRRTLGYLQAYECST